MRALLVLSLLLPALAAAERPNIVLLVGDDLGLQVGCYGDPLARTPHLDRLAAEGGRWTNAFTHCPVCAPTRAGLITGRHPLRSGAMHMRSLQAHPPAMLTDVLRLAGYTVLWPGKTDFNAAVPKGSFSSTADWVHGEVELKEPFLAYWNLSHVHESHQFDDAERFAKLTAAVTPGQRQDPAKQMIPPWLPDLPEVRLALARQREMTSALDAEVGQILAKLDRRGLAQRTVVILVGDNGPGIPRHKRWCYDGGIHEPLLVRWPGAIPPGTVREAPVALLDVGATCVAIAGLPQPPGLDAIPFLGQGAGEREYVVAHRDRMDDVTDRIRCVRDRRFSYIRNLMPDLPRGQRIDFAWQVPAWPAWEVAAMAGILAPVQAAFWAPTKPPEELYDCLADPEQIRNLAGDPAHAGTLALMRQRLDGFIAGGDLGAVPEPELLERGVLSPRPKKTPKTP